MCVTSEPEKLSDQKFSLNAHLCIAAVHNVGTNVRKPTVEYSDDDYHQLMSTNWNHHTSSVRCCVAHLAQHQALDTGCELAWLFDGFDGSQYHTSYRQGKYVTQQLSENKSKNTLVS